MEFKGELKKKWAGVKIITHSNHYLTNKKDVNFTDIQFVSEIIVNSS